MPSCAVKYCHSKGRKSVEQNKKNQKITFHTFPTDPILADAWIRIVRKSKNESWWKPKPRSYICSVHFKKSEKYISNGGYQKIKKGAVPCKHLYLHIRPESSEEESDDDNLNENSTTLSNPTTSAELMRPDCKIEEQAVPRAESPNSLDNVDISDLDYVFDKPLEAALKKVIEKLKHDKKKLVKRNIALARQNRIYKKRLSSVNYMLKVLLKKNVLSQELYTELNLKCVINSVKQKIDEGEDD